MARSSAPKGRYTGTIYRHRPFDRTRTRIYRPPTVAAGVTRTNIAEGGTNGVTVTTGNSGGASGDAFDAFTSFSPTFSNLHPATASLGYRFQVDGTGFAWEGLNATQLYGRVYVYFMALDAGAVWRVIEFLTSGYTTLASVNVFGGDGKVYLWDTTGTITSSTTVLSANTLYRIECYAVAHPSAGSLEVRLYAGHSTTPLETVSYSGQNTGSLFDVNRRLLASGAGNAFLDDLGLSSSTWLGPTGAPASLVLISDVF